MYVVDENTQYIEETAGGEKRKFYLLGPQDRIDLTAARKRDRRASLVENLKASGLSPEQQFTELETFEDRWDDEAEFIRLVNSSSGDKAIPVAALRLDDRAEAERIVRDLRVPRGKMLAFKAALTGLELVSRKEDAPDPNPQAPTAVYGRPGADTGNSTDAPAASPTGSPA